MHGPGGKPNEGGNAKHGNTLTNINEWECAKHVKTHGLEYANPEGGSGGNEGGAATSN